MAALEILRLSRESKGGIPRRTASITQPLCSTCYRINNRSRTRPNYSPLFLVSVDTCNELDQCTNFFFLIQRLFCVCSCVCVCLRNDRQWNTISVQTRRLSVVSFFVRRTADVNKESDICYAKFCVCSQGECSEMELVARNGEFSMLHSSCARDTTHECVFCTNVRLDRTIFTLFAFFFFYVLTSTFG